MTAEIEPIAYWNVLYPEVTARVTVAARTMDETRSIAWARWYGRPPRSELEALTLAALLVEQTAEPEEHGGNK